MKECGFGIITLYVYTRGHIEMPPPKKLENERYALAFLFLCKLSSWEEQNHLRERQICS